MNNLRASVNKAEQIQSDWIIHLSGHKEHFGSSHEKKDKSRWLQHIRQQYNEIFVLDVYIYSYHMAQFSKQYFIWFIWFIFESSVF